MRVKLLQRSEYLTGYEDWLNRVLVGHPHFIEVRNESIPFTRPRVPLNEARVALLSTGGVHLAGQEPFDIASSQGDWTWRVIPGDSATEALRFTHSHYDHTDADRDPNCVFPLEHLRLLAAEGVIGQVSAVHVGMMGFIPDGRPVLHETAPAVAGLLRDAGVDIAVMSPG